MNDETLKELLEQYLTGTITSSSKKELAGLMDQPEYREKLELLMKETFMAESYVNEGNEKLHTEIQEWLGEKIAGDDRTKIIELQSTVAKRSSLIWYRRWQSVAAAAVIILVVGVLLYKWQNNRKDFSPREAPSVAQSDANAPGKYKAKLKLADGSVIILDSAISGKLAQQGNVDVINQNGRLIYQRSHSDKSEVLYNAVFTSNGETYAMILSDGTKVWLNAQSSIDFPNSFAGDERKVEITGEAYFEVEHNPTKPFHVTVNGMDVQVLGTRFNINAYGDEPNMTTTLLEGKVKVTKDDATGFLSPGSQAIITGKNNLKILNNVNTDQVVAWKEGFFNFDQTELKEFLRQIARWYDVEIVYQSEIPDRRLFGIMNRNSSLNSALAALKANNIKFHLERKKLIVTQ
ncbi:MAG TPA: FecR domain-containing protein [Chitinophagaceae bacterium]|nr:FecR domain-containing protein [Chitinophagaceae bacterium]